MYLTRKSVSLFSFRLKTFLFSSRFSWSLFCTSYCSSIHGCRSSLSRSKLQCPCLWCRPKLWAVEKSSSGLDSSFSSFSVVSETYQAHCCLGASLSLGGMFHISSISRVLCSLSSDVFSTVTFSGRPEHHHAGYLLYFFMLCFSSLAITTKKPLMLAYIS